MKNLRRVLGLLLLGVVLAGCSFVPADSQPRTISADQVPFDLLSKQPPHHGGTPSNIYVRRPLYLVNAANTLTKVTRLVGVPASAITMLDALLAGPTEAEADAGDRTDISRQLHVIAADDVNGIMVIQLSGVIANRPELLSRADAQLVLTATSASGLNDATLVLNGVPLPANIPVGRPSVIVHPWEFSSLLAK